MLIIFAIICFCHAILANYSPFPKQIGTIVVDQRHICQCLLWLISGHKSPKPKESAFEGKADVLTSNRNHWFSVFLFLACHHYDEGKNPDLQTAWTLDQVQGDELVQNITSKLLLQFAHGDHGVAGTQRLVERSDAADFEAVQHISEDFGRCN